MNNIPSTYYSLLNKQKPLDEILDSIFHQIQLIKQNKFLNSKNINFELEFRLLNNYSNINFEEFVNQKSCSYMEYLYNENQNTKYRIICNSQYKSNESSISNINREIDNKNNEGIANKENILISNNDNKLESELYKYLQKIEDKEITHTLNDKIEYTKKLTVMTAYYFIFKIALNIEIYLENENIIEFLNDNTIINRNVGKKCIEYIILNYNEPILKKRRSFIVNNDVRLDVTYFNEQSHLELDFSNNIYHDRLDMINIVHDMLKIIDSSLFVIDYLFLLLPNFEFQKPITPSFDILFNNAKQLVEDTFYISIKADGIRKLLIIINNLMFSLTENFKVEFIDKIENNFQIIMDCEYVNNFFIPFDIIYNDGDLRKRKYSERIEILNSLKFNLFGKNVLKKDIKIGNSFEDIQKFIISEKENIPNDGIVITSSTSLYYENFKVYKIKTLNTVDIEFNGKYFLAKEIKIKKNLLKMSLDQFKKICALFNEFKKINKNNKNKYIYRKKIDIVDCVPYQKKLVKYECVKIKNIPFIIEYDLDNNKFIKIRNDKLSSNSINTFNSILLASYQKININIFNKESNVLMRKYHNIIKYNILKNFKGKLLDIGTGVGGDIHKWENFNKIFCIEPDIKKIEVLNERISKSNLKSKISIIQNKIQNIKLTETFDIATCFFTLNDFTYSDIYEMLENIKDNINGNFIILFFDNDAVTDDIVSHSITYKKCISNINNNINIILDKTEPTYMISLLRYYHKECENIMYVNIKDSNIINHYESSISSKKVIDIFYEFNFKLLNKNYTVDFPLLDLNQIKYTSYLKIMEFTNL